MTEGRPIHGKDVEENLEDYVKERMEYASDSDEYAKIDHELKQELADLEALQAERAGDDPRHNIEAVIEETEARIDRLRKSMGQLEATSGSQVDLEQTPPEAEARAQVTDRIGHHQAGIGNIRESS